MWSASARKSSPPTVAAVRRQEICKSRSGCGSTPVRSWAPTSVQSRSGIKVGDGCEDELTCGNWVLLFSYCLFLKGGSAQACGVKGRPPGLYRPSCEYCRRNLSRAPFFSRHSVIRQPAIYSLGGETLISAWLCLFCCGADRREPSVLIHVSSQVSDASNLYSRWLHNYILEKIRPRLTGFWTCKMCASIPSFCFSYF